MKRRFLLGASALVAALGLSGMAQAQDLPPLEQKDRYTVGFAQMESPTTPGASPRPSRSRTPPRAAAGTSIVTDAGGSAAKQVADVDR